ncbi:MAG: choice-of-anchor A family protein [Saprospiraceae bacterium]|nr:choice-of-anchor A family protein [Saprospiraceae bacterium]
MPGVNGNPHGLYILWNFTGSTTYTLNIMTPSLIVGTVYAPNHNLVKTGTGDIDGQVIAKTATLSTGEIHYYPFTGNITGCTPSNPPVVCSNMKALAQSDLNLVKTRTVTNEISCGSMPDRVMWFSCLMDNATGGSTSNAEYWKIVSGGAFKEYCDGTAQVDMTIQNVYNANWKFDVSMIFSGRTFSAPAGSPHIEGCSTTSALSNWYYYTNVNGTMVGSNLLNGAVVSFMQKMAAFQIGTNGSLWGTTGQFGGSGWISYNVLMHPSGITLGEGCGADINLF